MLLQKKKKEKEKTHEFYLVVVPKTSEKAKYFKCIRDLAYICRGLTFIQIQILYSRSLTTRKMSRIVVSIQT